MSKRCLDCDVTYSYLMSACPKCGGSQWQKSDEPAQFRASPGTRPRAQYHYEEEQDSGIQGWIIFILIFVVGNLILYATTGIFLIPIPRR